MNPAVILAAPAMRNMDTADDGVDTLLDLSAIPYDLDTPCRSNNADLWFAEQATDIAKAKALCGDCPLKKQCLEGALGRQEPWGVWGGEVLVDGRIVANKRGRGRPRKHPVVALAS
ncbi:WhiB family transcriptional regulator, redox-sensing transcriptional regulator [Micrococcales bacterium KH10]|nr:WhiB family transcriptional regulator, redox-sensing transcriptional regulator [Micrococcales bacterium KH10]